MIAWASLKPMLTLHDDVCVQFPTSAGDDGQVGLNLNSIYPFLSLNVRIYKKKV